MLRKDSMLCMNAKVIEYLHDRQVLSQAPAVPRQLPRRHPWCQGRERKTKWQREMEGRRHHRHQITGLGSRSVSCIGLGPNLYHCAAWSIYSEGTEIKCRAATQLLGETDWMHVMPEHFAVCAEELDFPDPSRPHGDCPPLSICDNHAFLIDPLSWFWPLCAVLYAYHHTPMRSRCAEPMHCIPC